MTDNYLFSFFPDLTFVWCLVVLLNASHLPLRLLTLSFNLWYNMSFKAEGRISECPDMTWRLLDMYTMI